MYLYMYLCIQYYDEIWYMIIITGYVICMYMYLYMYLCIQYYKIYNLQAMNQLETDNP